MQRLQQLTVFLSSVGGLVIGKTSIYQRLPNTKPAIGRMWERWLKLVVVMVRSPQDLQQWLLVVFQTVDQGIEVLY